MTTKKRTRFVFGPWSYARPTSRLLRGWIPVGYSGLAEMESTGFLSIEPRIRSIVQRLVGGLRTGLGTHPVLSCGGHRTRTYRTTPILDRWLRERPFVIVVASFSSRNEEQDFVRLATAVVATVASMVGTFDLRRLPSRWSGPLVQDDSELGWVLGGRAALVAAFEERDLRELVARR